MLYKFVEPKKRVFSRQSNVDSLAYTPLHVQIERMLASGQNLIAFRKQLNSSSLFSADEASSDEDAPSSIVYKPDMVEAQQLARQAVDKLQKIQQKKVAEEKNTTLGHDLAENPTLGHKSVSPAEQVADSDA